MLPGVFRCIILGISVGVANTVKEKKEYEVGATERGWAINKFNYIEKDAP